MTEKLAIIRPIPLTPGLPSVRSGAAGLPRGWVAGDVCRRAGQARARAERAKPAPEWAGLAFVSLPLGVALAAGQGHGPAAAARRRQPALPIREKRLARPLAMRTKVVEMATMINPRAATRPQRASATAR